MGLLLAFSIVLAVVSLVILLLLIGICIDTFEEKVRKK